MRGKPKEGNRKTERIIKRRETDILDPELVAWNKIILDFYGRCFS